MANTKVTGDLIAQGTIHSVNLADGSVNAAKLHNISTDHISEGTNLFYTDARVSTYLTTNNYVTTTEIANTANWDEAYNWGDHALVGYLTSFTETDPIFTASDAFAITSTQITNWDNAYGWGNHAGLYSLLGHTHTESEITDFGNYVTGITHDTVNTKLVVTNRDTTTVDLSLAQYVDDTNLARLVSGTVNISTGIATFTRDDATTFDVDFSALLDDTNDYVTSASFNTSDGVLTLTRFGGATVTVNLDDRYLTSAFIEDKGTYTSDLDALTASGDQGWYAWGSTQPTNSPGWNYGGVFVIRDSSQNLQLAFGGSGDNNQRLAVRRADSGSYGPWTEFYSTADFSTTDISNWNTAYGWGDHSSAGYAASSSLSNYLPLSGGTMSGDIDMGGGKITNLYGIVLNNEELADLTLDGQIAFDLNDSDAPAFLGTYGGTAPDGLYFRGSSTNYQVYHTGHFSGTNISNWQTAYGWGDHASAGYQSASSSFFKPFGELGSAVNLNDFRTTGYASQNSNSHAAAGSNYPTPFAGMLEVINDDTGNGIHTLQRYARYGSNYCYARYYYNGSWTSWARFLTTLDEGSGNGLDADTVDGLQASQFLRSDTNDTMSGNLDVDGTIQANGVVNVVGTDGSNPSAASDHIRVSGYGILGNRGTFYVTNPGVVQIGVGSIHNQDPAASFAPGSISLLKSTTVSGSVTATGSITAESTGYVEVSANQTDSVQVKIGVSSGSTEGFIMTANQGSGHIKQDTSVKILTYSSAEALVESARFTTTGLGLGGQTAPSYPLDVTGRARITDDLFVGDIIYHNGDTNTYMQFLGDRIRFYAGAVQMIDMVEGATDYIDFANNTARITSGGSFECTGDIIAYTSTSLSDERQKENIKKIDSPVEKIKQINGYTFNWKHNEASSGGVIAQEVEKVLPEIVKEKSIMDSEPHKTVEYNGLIGLLIETVKELSNKVEELENKLNGTN
jgi:hypothetical protein